MSTITEVLNTGNFAVFNKNVAKTFIWNNSFRTETFLNPTGGTLTYAIGTLLGRVTASGKLVALQSDAVDGSQIPVGILAQEVTLDAAAEDSVPVCIGGEVAEEKVVLVKIGDTFATDISGRTIRDRINGDTLGIKLVVADELTGTDNA